jgi:carboxypeptidase C (cathepsin A)
MLRVSLLSLLLALLSKQSTADCLVQEHPDAMTHMPGMNQPLPSKWFSGYLDYEFEGQQVHTHYVLVEAEDNMAGDKPLIYWSNGGPGASSLFGLLTELGPLLLSDDSLDTQEYKKTGIPTPIYNPYAWNRLGHLLIIDQPAPVGFSYCGDDLESHSCGGIAWTDELTSLNSYTALQTFFSTKFPCLIDLPMFLTGESYAGIYVPTLARRIYNDLETNKIQLHGFAVGDGCLGVETSMCGELSLAHGSYLAQVFWDILFMAGHHQIPLQDFRAIFKACHHQDRHDFLMTNSKDDETCKAVVMKVKSEIGGYFEYALYDRCIYRNGLLKSRPRVRGALYDYPCGGGPVMESYFKMDAVKDAFHVQSDFFEVDNAEGDFDYTPTEPDLSGFYKEINGKLRVLVYNGDTDPAINSFATANWTSHLGLDEISHWSPWTSDGCQQMGGYITRYEGGFDFLTIRGAGHMVPTYAPEASFAFMKSWIMNEDYPTFNPNCTQPTAASESTRVARDTKTNEQEINLQDSSTMLRG